MRSSSTLANLRIYALLFAALCGSILSGCEKIPVEGPRPEHSPFDALRTAFASAGYEKALIQSFNDTAKVYWEPNWQAGYNKKDAQGTAYTFVLLTPVLRSTKGPYRDSNFIMLGVRKFILIKHAKPTDSFSLATYIAATPHKLPVAVAAAKPFLFSTFSGVLLLRGLSTNEHARLLYQKGVRVAQMAKPLGAAKGNTASRTLSTEGYECVDYYTCYWYAGCRDDTSHYITYGATTSGIDGCSEPGYEPCDVWGMSWNSNGYDIEQQCTYVEDPPNPDDPYGDGGYGNNSITSEYVDPNYTFTQGPEPPDVSEYNCAQLRNTHADDPIQGGQRHYRLFSRRITDW